MPTAQWGPEYYRVSQKSDYGMLFKPWCTGWITSGCHHLGLESVFFGRFLLRLSRVNRPQVMSMVKFSPTAFKFGYDFAALVHFFGKPSIVTTVKLLWALRLSPAVDSFGRPTKLSLPAYQTKPTTQSLSNKAYQNKPTAPTKATKVCLASPTKLTANLPNQN